VSISPDGTIAYLNPDGGADVHGWDLDTNTELPAHGGGLDYIDCADNGNMVGVNVNGAAYQTIGNEYKSYTHLGSGYKLMSASHDFKWLVATTTDGKLQRYIDNKWVTIDDNPDLIIGFKTIVVAEHYGKYYVYCLSMEGAFYQYDLQSNKFAKIEYTGISGNGIMVEFDIDDKGFLACLGNARSGGYMICDK
jgi:WD40 repeat protein